MIKHMYNLIQQLYIYLSIKILKMTQITNKYSQEIQSSLCKTRHSLHQVSDIDQRIHKRMIQLNQKMVIISQNKQSKLHQHQNQVKKDQNEANVQQNMMLAKRNHQLECIDADKEKVIKELRQKIIIIGQQMGNKQRMDQVNQQTKCSYAEQLNRQKQISNNLREQLNMKYNQMFQRANHLQSLFRHSEANLQQKMQVIQNYNLQLHTLSKNIHYDLAQTISAQINYRIPIIKHISMGFHQHITRLKESSQFKSFLNQKQKSLESQLLKAIQLQKQKVQLLLCIKGLQNEIYQRDDTIHELLLEKQHFQIHNNHQSQQNISSQLRQTQQLTSRIDYLQIYINTIRSETQEKMNQLQAQTTLELQYNLDKIQKNIQILRCLSDKMDDNSKLQQQNQKLNQLINTLNLQIYKLNQRQQQLQRHYITKGKDRINQLSMQVAQLTNRCKEYSQDIIHYSRENQQQQKEIHQLQLNMQRQTRQHQQLKVQLEHIAIVKNNSSEEMGKQNMNDDYVVEIGSLKQRVEELNRINEDNYSRYHLANQEINQQIVKLKEQLLSQKAINENWKKLAQETQTKYAKIQVQNKRLMAEHMMSGDQQSQLKSQSNIKISKNLPFDTLESDQAQINRCQQCFNKNVSSQNDYKQKYAQLCHKYRLQEDNLLCLHEKIKLMEKRQEKQYQSSLEEQLASKKKIIHELLVTNKYLSTALKKAEESCLELKEKNSILLKKQYSQQMISETKLSQKVEQIKRLKNSSLQQVNKSKEKSKIYENKLSSMKGDLKALSKMNSLQKADSIPKLKEQQSKNDC